MLHFFSLFSILVLTQNHISWENIKEHEIINIHQHIVQAILLVHTDADNFEIVM